MKSKILAGSCARRGFPIDGRLRGIGPSGDAQEYRELGRLRRSDGQLDAAVPRVIGFLRDPKTRAVLKMPVEAGVVVKVHVQAVLTGAVEITGKRGQGALEVGRATGGVVPLVADFVATAGIERQRIAITIERAIERHAG